MAGLYVIAAAVFAVALEVHASGDNANGAIIAAYRGAIIGCFIMQWAIQLKWIAQ